VLVAVVYVALTSGATSGMLAGSVAGLIQDALASPIIGVGGLAKSIVGFAVGAIGQQFIVTAAIPRLLVFMAATAAHAVLFQGCTSRSGCARLRRRGRRSQPRRLAIQWWGWWRLPPSSHFQA
jgi:rod shape-determining protein MreD